MSTIDSEALGQLTNAMVSLLPDFGSADPSPSLQVIPMQITPTGLGGFVGFDDGFVQEIVGRQIKATVSVHATAATRELLTGMVSAISSALLCAVRQKVMGFEILHMQADKTGSTPSVVVTAAEVDGGFMQVVSFNVLCEFLKTQGPVMPGGTIDTIPLDLTLNENGNAPTPVFRSAFETHGIEGFEIIDDPLAKTAKPSAWNYSPDTFRIEQLSRIRGGQQTANSAKKPGTYLMLSPRVCRLKKADYIIRTTVRSEGAGGIGVVFNWQDVDNFFFFLMDSGQNYRLLAKKSAGEFAHLSTPALDAAQGFAVDEDLDLKVRVGGTMYAVYLNGELILQGQDCAIVPPGRIGLMSRDNETACFYQLGLVQL